VTKPSDKKRIDWDRVAKMTLRVLPFFPIYGSVFNDLLKELESSRTELGVKVKRAASALEDASRLVAELQETLREKIAQVETLRAEYEKYQQLASIEEDKAKALIHQLQEAVGENQARERWIALLINVVAGLLVFVLGVWLSPWVTSFLGLTE
jgi:hypothetical protein